MQKSRSLDWDASIGPLVALTFDSEQAIIGTVLFSEDDRAAALAELRAEDFQDQTCRAIWAVLQGMQRAGETIDPVSVAAHTATRLQARLDAGFFFGLAALRPTWVGWESEAKRIRDAAARRRLLELAEALAAKARDGADPGDAAAMAQAALAAFVDRDSTDTPVSLYELARQKIDHAETLLGAGDCRYLERGAVLLLAAPSGVGKSHLAAQAATCWACGRIAFGLAPYGAPLRSLILQAENPPNDSRAIAAGMVTGLQLSQDEAAQVHARTRQVWLPGCTGDRFLARLRGALAAWPADIVFVDPLAGFAAGDLTKPETVQAFCRAGLGALAVQCRCALFVCHHIPKPTAARDKRKMGTYDYQYAGAGSADLVANWPRAVLTLEALDRGEFIIRAAKRRPPWLGSDGKQTWTIGLRHTESMVWEAFDAPPETRHRGRPEAPDPSVFVGQVTELFREHGPMCKDVFEARLKALAIPREAGRACIALLVQAGTLVTWKGKGAAKIVGLATAKPEGACAAGTGRAFAGRA